MLNHSSSFNTFSLLIFRAAWALLSAATFAACGGGGGETPAECLPEVMAPCTPTINTDFESLHRNLFAKRCGTSGGACHGPDGRQGDLVLADPESAYNALLGMDGTEPRVSPYDPACSELVQRLESDDPTKRMPLLEGKISEGLRCAVRMWIEEGAAR